MKVYYLNLLITVVLYPFLSCTGNMLKEELEIAKKDWNYALPLLSDNDSLNLLFIRAEKCWYMFHVQESDSLCDMMLPIDSTFHQALSFRAWVPLNLTYLNKAMAYAKKDTSVHRTVLEADYAFCVNGDTVTAMQKFKEVFDKYPNSHTASWCLGMAYLWTGRLDQAIEQYKVCLDISPIFLRANQMLGLVYYWKNENELSVENFETSFRYGNKTEADYRCAAKAYAKLGRLDKFNKYTQLANELNDK